MEPVPVGISVSTGQVIERVRSEGGILEATTPGVFMVPDGDKEYATFLEMLRDQPKMEDPVFAEGEVAWTVEEAGFPLEKMDEYDTEFKKMYDDMFSRSSEMGVMGAGDFEARLAALKNELSDSKIETSNGGGINVLSTGEPAVHPPQRPSTPFCPDVQIPFAGPLVPLSAEGGDASDTKVDDE